MTSNVTRFAIDVGEVLLGGDPADVAKARNRAGRILPPIVGFTAGCGLGAACDAALGTWSLALPAGLALLAFAMGFAAETDDGHTDEPVALFTTITLWHFDAARTRLTRGRRVLARWSAALADAARAAGPPLLFGLRLWASVCLALYVAFWLELDNPSWAGTSAVSAPAWCLRKGWYRIIGTFVGAVVIVILTAWFPQARAPFLVALALWGATCALVGVLRGGAGRLHGRDHRSRRARGDGRPERRCGLPARRHPCQRNLHRYCKRRHRSRGDRFRRRPAPARSIIRCPVSRNRGPVYRHVGAGRAGNAEDAACSARAGPAGHSARPGHRRGNRRILPAPL
jgi:hypothetical protein